MPVSAHDAFTFIVFLVLAILAVTGKRRGLRAAFKVSQEIANREGDTARQMAAVCRENGDYSVAANLDAQADALRQLAIMLDYRMASSFLKKDPQEEDEGE